MSVKRKAIIFANLQDESSYCGFKYKYVLFFVYSQGESTYNLRDAQECRSKLDKIAEFVDGYRFLYYRIPILMVPNSE